MKVRILSLCLITTLFANATFSASDPKRIIHTVFPIGVLLTVAGVAMTIAGFAPAYGDAADYIQFCGENVTACSIPFCTTVETCQKTDNVGRLLCVACRGGGNDQSWLAPSIYRGTSWGAPVGLTGVVFVVAGVVAMVFAGCLHYGNADVGVGSEPLL